MTGAVGILCSTHDALRSLVGELSELLADRRSTPVRLLIEDLSGHSKAEKYPGVVLVLSNHPEAARAAGWLATLGVTVVNGKFFARMTDRVSIRLRLEEQGVATLPFAFASHPSVFTDTKLWNAYPAILKASTKDAAWPVVSSIGELHDWVEATRPRQFGWLIERYIKTAVTIKWYFVGRECYAVNKRDRNDMAASTNTENDVASVGWQIARVLSLDVGSIDLVRDAGGNLWPVDVNVIPAFRVWPRGYPLLADYLTRQGAGP